MKPDAKPFLSSQETVAALTFAQNRFVSKTERRIAMTDVMKNLATLPDHEVHGDGTVTILFERQGVVHVQTINPSLIEQ